MASQLSNLSSILRTELNRSGHVEVEKLPSYLENIYWTASAIRLFPRSEITDLASMVYRNLGRVLLNPDQTSAYRIFNVIARNHQQLREEPQGLLRLIELIPVLWP